MKLIGSLFILILSQTVWAGIPQVPSKMRFANLNLVINKGAKYKIQKEVDKLHRSKTYFDKYVKKADLHFPIIEAEFDKLGCPEDIKYLILQETGINATAVSTSNAVGYWQFKKATGIEVGLTIASGIDERKNIAAASNGCATYMTRNYKRVKNWIYTVMAYNTGVGGAERYIKSKYQGASKMEITSSTHWYVIKFLAHIIAYQDYVGKEAHEQKLLAIPAKSGQSVKSISKKYHLTQEVVKPYNEWISFSKKIPVGKTYYVILPVKNDGVVTTTKKPELDNSEPTYDSHSEDLTLVVPAVSKRSMINGINVVIPKEGETVVSLALLGGITQKKFRKYNELRSFDQIIPGMPYYFKAKKAKGRVEYHVAQPGESTWSIAQKHGMKEWSLRTKNRMKKLEALVPGRVVWLQKTRPESTPIEIRTIKKEQKFDAVEMIMPSPIPTDSALIRDRLIKEEVVKDTMVQENQVEELKSNGTTHIVTKGETLYSISKKYNISVENIKSWNDLGNTGLSIGQELIISEKAVEEEVKQPEKEKPEATKEEFEVYKIQKGDTMYSLSKKFNVSVEDIRTWNNKTDNSLSLGEEIKIKK